MSSSPPVPPPDTVYVSFSAEVTPHTTENLIAVMANQANQGVKNVHLLLSTPGGSVMHGMTLYNVLRAMPFHLITHNVGNVDSIGNAIFLAGVARYACPHSTFMFHGVGFDSPQGVRLEEKLLRERLAALQADQLRIGSVIGERTQIKGRAISKLFLEAQTKDAAYAKSNGIIDDIREVEIPTGTPILQLVFQR